MNNSALSADTICVCNLTRCIELPNNKLPPIWMIDNNL